MSIAFNGNTQNYSTDVELVSDSGNGFVTLQSTASAPKKKDAEDLAVKSAFYTLLTSGVSGLNNGIPLITDLRNDYEYRLFKENRYVNFLKGQPVLSKCVKVANQQQATVVLAINLNALKTELERNKLILSPAWSNGKEVRPEKTLNPVIVIVPYVDSKTGYGFEAMRDQFENDAVKRFVIDKVAETFIKHGYKTYDFVNILQDSKLNDILRQGAQTDDATMIVQQMPGDIIVTAEVNVNTDGGISELNLSLRALEKQTSGRLASKEFSSDKHHTTNANMLATYAVGKIQNDFFNQLSSAFDDMVRKGREVTIDLNLSETVNDWDFEQDAPGTGNYFKDELDDWLRDNSVGQVYDMSRSTDKYVHISLNVPIWDMERNRTLTLSNFGSRLRSFLRKQLGDEYKAKVTAMGQKLSVIIE